MCPYPVHLFAVQHQDDSPVFAGCGPRSATLISLAGIARDDDVLPPTSLPIIKRPCSDRPIGSVEDDIDGNLPGCCCKFLRAWLINY